MDCITKDGPVPGALWTFLLQTTSKKVKKYDFRPVESTVADEKVHVPNFGGLSGSEDRGGGDNSIEFINFGRVGDTSFTEW